MMKTKSSVIEKLITIDNIKDAHRAKIYYQIYSSTQKSAKKEADFIVKVLNLQKGSKVLDLGCGFGRHSIELAEKGMKVVGVDISRSLLKIAKERAKKRRCKIKFLQKNFLKISFKEKFDAAIMMLNTFGLMSDKNNERALEILTNLLKHGGKLLVDLRNPGRLREGKIYKNPEIIKGVRVWTGCVYVKQQKRVIIKRTLYLKDGKQYTYILAVRLYFLSELKKLLSKHGFKITKIFGDFSGNPYRRKKSPRLIVVAEKK
ncbi:class I SAM-dependent methyltransferase [bacterium]|nr:class I SAM-dependent methyltransferase [bacterium]